MVLNKIKINDTTTVNTGIVYDISKAHNGTTYTDLTDALGTNGGVPDEFREGGMSVKFIQTSDNKYVQYMLTLNSWNNNALYWQKINGDIYDKDFAIQFSSSSYNNLIFAPGTTLRIKLSEYSGSAPVYIFGMKQLSPQVYDTIVEDMQVGQTVEFIYDENWLNIRLYKNDSLPIKFEVTSIGILSSIDSRITNIENELVEDGDSREINFSSIEYNDLVFKQGTELKISLDEYSGSAPVYIFGMKQLSPQVYDTIVEDMQVGQTVKFIYDENWLNIRLYKNDTNPITFTVTVGEGIIPEMEKRLSNVEDSLSNVEDSLSNVEDSLSILIGEPEEIKFSEGDYNSLVFPAGTPIDIKLLEQTGSGAVYIFGMISENPLVYDTLADHMQVGDNVAFEYKENWTNIRLYKQDTQPIKFEVRPNGLVPSLSVEVKEQELEISDLQQKVLSTTDETSQNVQFSSYDYNNLVFGPGTKIKITLLSYSGEQPVYIFGMKQLSPQVYDTIADHMQVGQTVEFIYDEAWLNVRLYKNDTLPIEFNVVSIGAIPQIQEEIKGESEEIQFSEGQYNNLVFPADTPVSIKLLEHDVDGTVYIFGMISQNPLVYDTIAENMQVGQTVTFEYKENWTNIRLYQTNAGNIKFAVVSDGINQKIDILNQKIENSGAGTIDSVDRLPSMSQNPLSRILREPGYGSIIHTWGIIGDSLSSGCTECREKGTSGKIFLDRFEYSWGQCLFRLLNVEGYNFSYSGQQTKPWCLGWTQIQTTSVPPSTTTTPEDRIWDGELVGVVGQHGAKYNPKQGYIIALGVNDASRNEFPLGTISDINLNDYTQNGDSFYGYYAGIIQRVRSIAPDCFVFCVTRPGSGGSTTYDKAIRDIVELFDKCYCIDLANGVNYDSNFISRYYLGGHMNAAGYEYTAYVMNTYIDWIIRNNFSDFKNAALVGTPYEIVP